MFGIGLTELLIIVIVALVFIGPEKMPDFAKKLGRIFGDLKRTGDDLKKTVKEEMVQELPDDDTLRDTEANPPEIKENSHEITQELPETGDEGGPPIAPPQEGDKPGFAPGKKPIKKKAVKMDGDSLPEHAMDLSAVTDKDLDSGESS